MTEFRVYISGQRRQELDNPGAAFASCRDYHLHLKRVFGKAGVIVLTPHTRWRAKSERM